MSITLYSISRYGDFTLETHEYDRVTEQFAIRRKNGREVREKLHHAYGDLFETPEQAVAHRRSYLEGQVEKYKQGLAGYEADLKAFNRKHREAKA